MITSTSNDRIKEVRRLRTRKGRRAAGRSMAEGPHVLGPVIEAGMRITSVLARVDDHETADTARLHRLDLVTVSGDVLAAASDTRAPQGPLVVFEVPEPAPPRRHDQVVLHDVADPGNVGTILRTAVAFGWDVTLSGRTADPWSPKVIRASAGAVFAARLAGIADIDELGLLGVRTVATVVGSGVRPERPDTDPIALLIGSEAAGLPGPVVDRADLRWTIPMREGTESLNAAVAAAILMYACTSTTELGTEGDL